MGKVKDKQQKVFNDCEEIYNEHGYGEVIDFINTKKLMNAPEYIDVEFERCDACGNDMPALNHTCLICGQETKVESTSLLDELREQAQELIDLGDSHEKAKGQGMLEVLDAITSGDKYFNLVSMGENKSLQREEVQIHCGENGNLYLIKTDEGFIVDVYGQEGDVLDSMTIWEDDLTPEEE